jgi:serine/threonine-protein kinase
VGIDTQSGRPCVIKQLYGQYLTDEHLRHKFLEEASLLALLADPGFCSNMRIAPAYYGSSGANDRECWIAMELIPGKTLRQELADCRGAGLGVPRSAEVARWVSTALCFIHQRGIIHRDISPENVIALPGGDFRLIDFGTARAEFWRSYTPPGNIMGKVLFLAPEVWDTYAATEAADVYALGVMFYEMLVGRPPFEDRGQGLGAIRHQHMSAIPDLAPLNRLRLAPGARAAVMGMLRKSPHERWTAYQVYHALST